MIIILVMISGIVILTLLAIIGFLKFKSNGKKNYRRPDEEENTSSTQIDVDEKCNQEPKTWQEVGKMSNKKYANYSYENK